LIYIAIFTDSIRTQGSLENRGDTVGQPPNAENDASHLLSLQAQKSRESNAVTAAVVCGNRMTNSIGEVFEILRKTVPLTDIEQP
jgi:hypothetical protein